jgi:hypothetical protein
MSDEKDWFRVGGQQEESLLLDLARDFHDAVATLACWEGAEHVNSAGELAMAGYGKLTLRISSQFLDVPDLELRFRGVRAFRYEYEFDFEPSIVFESQGISAKLITWEIQAEGLEYRSLDVQQTQENKR